MIQKEKRREAKSQQRVYTCKHNRTSLAIKIVKFRVKVAIAMIATNDK